MQPQTHRSSRQHSSSLVHSFLPTTALATLSVIFRAVSVQKSISFPVSSMVSNSPFFCICSHDTACFVFDLLPFFILLQAIIPPYGTLFNPQTIKASAAHAAVPDSAQAIYIFLVIFAIPPGTAPPKGDICRAVQEFTAQK